jgi:hypothetical protein
MIEDKAPCQCGSGLVKICLLALIACTTILGIQQAIISGRDKTASGCQSSKVMIVDGDSIFHWMVDTLKKTESTKYSDVSPSGYLGRYQFHPSTLRLLGYTGTKEQFLADSALQDLWLRIEIAHARLHGRKTFKEIYKLHAYGDK